MSSQGCIFCRIGAGEIPARKVFESSDCVAFLDISPLAPGHTLLIPKQHYTALPDMPAEQAAAVLCHLPVVGDAVVAATGAEGLNVLCNVGQVAGQAVMHVHFHLIPRKAGDDLGYRWNPKSIEDATADELRDKISARLQG